jgi:hypothetical protein
MTKSIFGKAAALGLLATVWTIADAAAEPREKYRGDRGDQPRERRTAGGLIIDSEERYVKILGSNIPQKVRRRSIGTDSVSNVRIFTQRELQTINGGFGVGGIALDPSVHISGR